MKQHLRILMLKQYSTGNIFKNYCKNPGASWTLLSAGGRAPPQDCREGVGAISDIMGLAGMQLLLKGEKKN